MKLSKKQFEELKRVIGDLDSLGNVAINKPASNRITLTFTHHYGVFQSLVFDMAGVPKDLSIILDDGKVWTLCKNTFYYCPTHGKCRGILEKLLPNHEEIVMALGSAPLFFCEKCGYVKMRDVWNNVHGICAAKLHLVNKQEKTWKLKCPKCGTISINTDWRHGPDLHYTDAFGSSICPACGLVSPQDAILVVNDALLKTSKSDDGKEDKRCN